MATPQSTPQSYPSSRRTSQVYVEVPPSPYPRVRNTNHSHVSVISFGLKENTAPFNPTAIQHVSHEKSSGTLTSAIKRKASTLEVVVDNQKKSKVSIPHDSGSQMVKSEPDARPSQNKRVSEEFPNGYFCCHHCRTKYELNYGIQCTIRVECLGHAQRRRCKAKYCMLCLKQRYGEDPDQILNTRQRPTSNSDVHVRDVRYFFKCLRCRGLCDCYRCRKDLIPKQKKEEIFPPPTWKPVDTGLSLADAEARIQVREFVFRFKALIDGITENHLEELDTLYGSDSDDDEPWVSHGCVKAIILALLQVIAQDETEATAKIINTALKDLRRIGAKLERVWGILSTLREELTTSAIMTDTSSPRHIPLTFLDPYSLFGANRTTRTTRSGSSQHITMAITHSAQMLPVLISLINLVLQTKRIRQEIENAGALGREWVADERYAHKAENERWALDRKLLMESCESQHLAEDKRAAQLNAREARRDKIFQDLGCALKITLSSCSVRVGPLGRDADGRVYWAVTPGMKDRGIALGILISGGRESKGKKTGKGKNRKQTREDRLSMTKWSSFLAVWGRRPEMVSNPVVDTDEVGEQNDQTDDEEQWWGFCEPEDIKKLASWISIHGIVEENSSDRDSSGEGSKSLSDSLGPSTRHEIKSLVQALKDYAEVLRWKIDREEAEDADDVSRG